jgi:hypothetical protein
MGLGLRILPVRAYRLTGFTIHRKISRPMKASRRDARIVMPMKSRLFFGVSCCPTLSERSIAGDICMRRHP